jgi:hypothetical protein
VGAEKSGWKGYFGDEVRDDWTLIVIGFFVLLGLAGWGANIGKLVDCDFKAPYKAEIIRVLGVIIPPGGAVIGFMEIKDE